MMNPDLPSDGSVDPPRYGHIQVEATSRCNLRCRTCLAHSLESQWLSTDLTEKSFARIVEIADRCKSIHLQGWGETLLRDDCADLIRRLKRQGVKVSLSSNGTLMAPKQAKGLIEAGLDSMAFSFAGPSAAVQDELRGKGTFDAAVKSVKTFVAERKGPSAPPVVLSYLLTPDNLKALPKAVGLCARLGADGLKGVHMVHVCTSDQEGLVAYHSRNGTTWLQVRARITARWKGVSLWLPPLHPVTVPLCEKNPLENFFVGSDGSVSPCVYLNPPLKGTFDRFIEGKEVPTSRVIMGNLHEQSMDDIWQTEGYRSFRKAFHERVRIDDELLARITPDFEGMKRLDGAVSRIKTLFAENYPPPEPCRYCGHVKGL